MTLFEIGCEQTTLRRLNRELFTPEQVASIADNVAGESWERSVMSIGVQKIVVVLKKLTCPLREQTEGTTTPA